MPSERARALRRRLGAAWLWAGALCFVDCQAERQDPTDGETHFLRSCVSDSQACGSELVCLCGVCTLPCSAAASCGDLPDATCELSDADAACRPAAGGRCDVGCAADAECGGLSAAHGCSAGFCRAPAAGPSACPTSELDPNQVLITGDSFFATGHRVTAFIEDLARQGGALGAGERYRDHSSLLGNTLALAGNGIEQQYAAAAEESPVRVVITNGGGADLLLGSCQQLDAACPLLVDAAAAASALFERLAEGGVEHVVYAFYPDPVDAELQSEMDVLRPLIESACRASPVPCHWLDLRPIFAGRYDTYVEADGNNPTASGAQAAAQAIWTTLRQRCIAQ